MKHPEDQVIQSLRCPKFIDYKLKASELYASPDQVLSDVKALLAQKGLGYPFVIKLFQASRATYSHSFYVVTKEEGLIEALKFEGFQDEHLLF